LDDALRRLSPKSEMAKAIAYGRKRWVALTRFLDDGRLEIDNNSKRCFPPTLCDVVIRADVGRYGSPQPYERTGHPHWSWSGACSPP
ncbi:IS66 family transposase, partial [Sphingobium sp. AS12]|nr:IS66 family transposase [Sphingobium sp. AS12]